MLFGWPTCIQPKVMLGFGSQQAAADDISRFVHADVSNIPNPRGQSPNDKSLCQGSDGYILAFSLKFVGSNNSVLFQCNHIHSTGGCWLTKAESQFIP